MFAFLNILALCKQIKKVDPSNAQAAFDIQLVDDNGQTTSITKNGYYIAFRKFGDDGQQERFIRLTKDKPTATENNNFNLKYEVKPKGENQQVSITLANTFGRLFEYEIAVFAAFPDNSNEVGYALHNFAIKGKTNGKYYANVIKGIKNSKSKIQDPTHVYLGKFNTNGVNPDSYPYWADPTDTTSGDQVLAFSWRGFVNPKTPIEVNFLVTQNPDFKLPVLVYDRTQNNFDQFPDQFDFTFDVISYEAGEVAVSASGYLCGISLNDTLPPFTSDGNTKISQRYTVRMDQKKPDVTNTFDCWVQVGGDYYLKNVYPEGTAEPSIQISESPDGKTLEQGQSVIVKGTALDEQEVTLFTKIDNANEMSHPTIVTAPRGIKTFQIERKLPNDISVSEHTLSIRVVDKIGKPASQITNIKFTVTKPTKPTIDKLFVSNPRVSKGMNVIVFGEVNAPGTQNVDILARWDSTTATPTTIYSFTSNGNKRLFSRFYTIPEENANYGKHTIYVEAVSPGGRSQMREVSVYVNDPNPSPANIKKIIDATSSLQAGKSAFNLKYDAGDGRSIPLSYNDEGFYAAFRLYNDEGYPKKEQYLLERGTTEREHISIKYVSEEDSASNYRLAKFEITNNGYYDQYIDFGVFVDSYWGESEQELKLRDDGTGIIVRDEKANLYYTVFGTYGDYPTIAHYNIAPNVKRPQTGEINTDDMPFFEGKDDKIFLGDDPMYSLHWQKQSLKAGQTTTLVLAFAGYDIVRTPSRIIATMKPGNAKRIAPNTQIDVTFTVTDENIGETLDYELTWTGKTEPEKGQITVEQKPFSLPHKFNVGNSNKFEFTFTVKDKQVEFPVSLSRSFLVSNQKFELTGFEKFQEKYFTTDKLRIKGTVNSQSPVFIKYQFGANAKVETLDGKYQGSVDQMISIPEEVFVNYRHHLIIWAETDEGIRSENEFVSDNFFVFARDAPVLHLAGLSKKRARKSEQILGYAYVTDTQFNQHFEIRVKFGSTGQYQALPNKGGIFHYTQEITDPVAFYWTVPSEAQAGKIYDVYIRAYDNTGLQSENEIPCTLYIEN